MISKIRGRSWNFDHDVFKSLVESNARLTADESVHNRGIVETNTMGIWTADELSKDNKQQIKRIIRSFADKVYKLIFFIRMVTSDEKWTVYDSRSSFQLSHYYYYYYHHYNKKKHVTWFPLITDAFQVNHGSWQNFTEK